jgi:hypothetical protein
MDNRLAALAPLTESERAHMRLRMARESLSEEGLSDTLGISRPTLRRILAGEKVRPRATVRARDWLQGLDAGRELVSAGGQRA